MKNLKEEVEKDLKYLVSEFKKCTSPHIFEDILGAYLALVNIIISQELDVKIPSEFKFESRKINTSKIDLKQAKKIITNFYKEAEYNKEVSKMYKILEDTYFEHTNDVHYNNKVELKESISLVGSFFENYDEEIAAFYYNFIDNERFFIGKPKEEEFNGVTYEGYKDMKKYIFISPTYTVVDQAIIAHEIIHAYIFKYQRFMSIAKRQVYNVNNFCEVYSSFIELVLLDYLRRNNRYIHDIECYQQEYDEDLRNNLACLNLQYEPELKSIKKFDDREFFLDIESYTYGKLLAYHFFDNYKDDKEKTKEDILNFTLDSEDYQRDYLLNNYGLKRDNIKNPNILIKHFNNHYYR